MQDDNSLIVLHHVCLQAADLKLQGGLVVLVAHFPGGAILAACYSYEQIE